VPFSIKGEDLVPAGDPSQTAGLGGLVIQLQVGYERDPSKSSIPPTVAAPVSESSGPDVANLPPAQVNVQILDANQNTLIAPRSINDGKPVTLADPAGHTPIRINITMESLAELTAREKTPLFYVHVASATAGIIYSVGPKPVQVIVPAAPGDQPAVIQPAADSQTGVTALPIIQGRSGTAGQPIRGGAG